MEGAPHTAKNNWCILEAPPAPIYKGGRGEEASLGAPQVGGVPLGLLVQFAAPFLLSWGERGKEREKEKERGAPPPSLLQFRLLPCGGRTSPLWAG